MKYINLITVILTILLIANCSTPYQPKGMLGGYSEEKILTNMYKVQFEGNQHSKPEEIHSYLMYRCAELTQEMGFDYFAIINEERHYKEKSVSPDRDVPFESRTSSPNVRTTMANPDLQIATKSTNYTGVYVIKFLIEVDEKYKNIIFYVPDVLNELSPIVKK